MSNPSLLRLKGELQNIKSAIGNRNVIYLDYPVHTNGGDLLIFLGTMAFFKTHNINVLGAFSCHNYDLDAIAKLIEQNSEVCIVLHGGGNFGDLYDSHQTLRNRIFSRFPNQRIVLFPQSAHYDSEHNIQSDRQIIGKLTDAFFFARDRHTLDLFKSMGVTATFSPDIAHQLYDCEYFPTIKPKEGTPLFFMRQDKERVTSELDSNESVDWINLLSWFDKKIIRVIVRSQKAKLSPENLSFAFWYWYADKLMKKISIKFSSHPSVVTSRLHGHIFSCLLERPNRVLDNSYGKNSRYIKQWTKDVEFLIKE